MAPSGQSIHSSGIGAARVQPLMLENTGRSGCSSISLRVIQMARSVLPAPGTAVIR